MVDMFHWHQKTVLPIGIDFGTRSLKLLQFRLRGGRLMLQAAARAEMAATSTNDAVAETLQRLLKSGPFVGRRCVTSLPASAIHTKSLRLPHMPENDLVQAVGWEAKDRLGFDPTEGRIAFFRAGEVHRSTETRDEILLFAAPGDTLRAHLQQLAAVKLQPVAIDLQPCAMLRAVARVTAGPAGGVHAIVDIGAGGSQILISQDEHMVFYKHIAIGATTFDNAVAHKLGVSPSEVAQIHSRLQHDGHLDDASSAHVEQAVTDALRPPLEELSHELDMCIRYYVVTFRGTRPEVVSVVGAQSHAERIMEPLTSTLGLRLEAAQPLRNVADLTEITRPDRSGDWAVAAGLSLYGLSPAAVEAAA